MVRLVGKLSTQEIMLRWLARADVARTGMLLPGLPAVCCLPEQPATSGQVTHVWGHGGAGWHPHGLGKPVTTTTANPNSSNHELQPPDCCMHVQCAVSLPAHA